jgi:diguanylate cyclase (GGDEF)-like protein
VSLYRIEALILRRERGVLTIAALFLLVHTATVVVLGTAGPGPVLSDSIQLILGALVILASSKASRRSEGLARSFWRLVAAAFAVWLVAQAMGVCNDIFPGLDATQWISNMLFCFWFVPLALAMFLDPEHEAGGLDTLVALDFIQAVIVCVAAYLYFFYLPKSDSRSAMAHSVWAPYFVGYGFVAGSFLLRAVITRSRVVRALFGRFGLFLAFSCVCDGMYFYGPGRDLKTGAWFDIIWSVLLVLPLALAATWKQADAPRSSVDPAKPEKRIYTELFHLFYPLIVLAMSLQIARERLALAAAVVFFSFVCSSARLLVTQHRLVQAQDALRREASRDSLTGLWNRKAILDILERELLRAQRQGEQVGLIMADVDHFKSVNDSRGHVAGDLVLRIIASEVASVVRPYDSVGRYGGEEFLIVAPNCGGSETWELAERVRVCVANCSVVTGGSSVNVSLSLGIAIGNSAADSEKLLHAADTALYQAKNAGRNRVEPTSSRAAAAVPDSLPNAQSKFWL